MPKTKTTYCCTECGNETPRWEGQCPACKEWNTLQEEVKFTGAAVKNSRARVGDLSVHGGATAAVPINLEDVSDQEVDRWNSGLNEFDFVLGGGIVPGSVVLLGGDPGIGKSTMTLQVLGDLLERGRTVLLVSGEESAGQVKARAARVATAALKVPFLGETDLEAILRRAERDKPAVLLVDSIQTVFWPELEGAPGSVGQVRECAARLQRFAKTTGCTVFMIGHVTKGGAIAGPQTLAHIVDTVVYFEDAGGEGFRILRTTKNRFGAANEIGVLQMTGTGLVGVANPSELFLSQRRDDTAGSTVVPLLEGTRPLLLEVQGLATLAQYGSPQRVANGFDHKRMSLLIAVMEKRLGLPFGQNDVFINAVGGLKVQEPAADAAVAVALVSSLMDRTVPADAAFVGELGLGGEMRAVSQMERRIQEAGKQGFRSVFVPERAARVNVDGVRVIAVDNVEQLLERAIGPLD